MSLLHCYTLLHRLLRRGSAPSGHQAGMAEFATELRKLTLSWKTETKVLNFDTINIYNVLPLFLKQVFLFFTIQCPWRKIWMVDFLQHFALLFGWQSLIRAKLASWHQSILILENEKWDKKNFSGSQSVKVHGAEKNDSSGSSQFQN